MARKTSKTNHVLNLLAGNGENEEDSVEKKLKPPASEAKESSNVNVQVIGSQNEDETIVNTVNRMLEKELEESEEPEAQGSPKEPEEQKAPEEPKGPEEQKAPEEPKEPEEQKAPEEPKEPEEQKAPEEPKEPENQDAGKSSGRTDAPQPGAGPLEEHMGKEEKGTNETEQPIDVNDAITAGLEPDYVFINVLERLVQDKVVFYMKQFGNCMCSRCIADVIALTLTNLPPRYEVVEKRAIAPLMNFYAQHYMGQITVEITKACTTVRERPHHGRD